MTVIELMNELALMPAGAEVMMRVSFFKSDFFSFGSLDSIHLDRNVVVGDLMVEDPPKSKPRKAKAPRKRKGKKSA